MAARYLKGVLPVKVWKLFLAAVPLQLFFLFAHFYWSYQRPQDALLRDAFPLVYLAGTYLQWLLFAFWISLRTKKYRVPLLMHLPHFLSFLPLLRLVALASEKETVETLSLHLAWVHSVLTHSFTLVAAWLWQVRAEFENPIWKKERYLPFLAYLAASSTMLVVYAGLDFTFKAPSNALALGTIQLLLYLAVGVLILLSEKTRMRLAFVALSVFVAVNTMLLFDPSRTGFSVEVALSGVTFTQLFSLCVFLVLSRK